MSLSLKTIRSAPRNCSLYSGFHFGLTFGPEVVEAMAHGRAIAIAEGEKDVNRIRTRANDPFPRARIDKWDTLLTIWRRHQKRGSCPGALRTFWNKSTPAASAYS